MEKEYTQIFPLKGPDRVRRRPAVMFGSDGAEGAATAVKMLLDIFFTEAVLGFSSGIDLTIHTDDSISIRSYDRGFALDETIIDGKPAWYRDFCELFCGVREPDDDYFLDLARHHNVLYGEAGTQIPKYQVNYDSSLDLCCVQYVSAYMHVEATRDGVKKTLDFEKGYSISDLHKESSSDPSNTFIHFQIDAEVFEDVNFPASAVVDFLRNAAITIPGLRCVMRDERDGAQYTFLYPNGLEDYAAEIATTPSIPLFTNEIEARGRDRYNFKKYDANVKIAFGFVKDSAKVMCLHNYSELKYGGYHLDAVKERLMHYINWEFIWDFKDELSPNDEDNYYSRRRFELSFEDIANNVVLILETKCPQYASNYVNATNTAIKNRMITDMAYDLIFKAFARYLEQNHKAIFDILQRIQRTTKKD